MKNVGPFQKSTHTEITDTPVGTTYHTIIAALAECHMVDDTRWESYTKPAHIYSLSKFDAVDGVPDEAWGYIEGTPFKFEVRFTRIRIFEMSSGQDMDAVRVVVHMPGGVHEHLYHPIKRALRPLPPRSKKLAWPRKCDEWPVIALDAGRHRSR